MCSSITDAQDPWKLQQTPSLVQTVTDLHLAHFLVCLPPLTHLYHLGTHHRPPLLNTTSDHFIAPLSSRPPPCPRRSPVPILNEFRLAHASPSEKMTSSPDLAPVEARLLDPSTFPTTALQVEMLAVVYLISTLAYITYGLRMYNRITSKQLGLGKHRGPSF